MKKSTTQKTPDITIENLIQANQDSILPKICCLKVDSFGDETFQVTVPRYMDLNRSYIDLGNAITKYTLEQMTKEIRIPTVTEMILITEEFKGLKKKDLPSARCLHYTDYTEFIIDFVFSMSNMIYKNTGKNATFCIFPKGIQDHIEGSSRFRYADTVPKDFYTVGKLGTQGNLEVIHVDNWHNDRIMVGSTNQSGIFDTAVKVSISEVKQIGGDSTLPTFHLSAKFSLVDILYSSFMVFPMKDMGILGNNEPEHVELLTG